MDRFKVFERMNREDWLKWRATGIGSSDASVIMGVSRFKDYNQLLSEKSHEYAKEDTETNKYIKNRGNKIEVNVREFLEWKFKKPLKPIDCQMVEFPFLKASLDGADEKREMIIEIKLLSIMSPDNPNYEAEGYIKWREARDNGIVPKEYYPQIQHQLFITGAKGCWFVGYKETRGNSIITPDKIAMVWVTPNEDYTKNLIDMELKFWLNRFIRREELQGKTYKGELE